MLVNERPYKFLLNHLGKIIRVYMKDSTCYEGKLNDFERSQHDGIGSIHLLDVKRIDQNEGEFDWFLIRGNNIFAIYLSEIKKKIIS